ncbi:MAG: glycogen/starch synthase [Tannerellaceae bacterium]|jgi:starch synthase|nr:glycogen/starch synthase [Tannerellaceae bacterium]
MEAKRVLFVAQEITPYLPASPISSLCRALPQAIQERGKEIRTFMPKFGAVNDRRNQLHEVIRLSGMNLVISDVDHPLTIKVASIQSARMQVYFIDNEDLFKRKGDVCSETGETYDDNDERSIFYVRGTLETIKKLRWIPDLVHCHGWFASLTPLYLRRMYVNDPCLHAARIVYSVYDNPFDTPLSPHLTDKLLADHACKEDLTELVKRADFIAINKLAIDFSDAVVQGSKHIHPELADYIQASGKPFLPYQDTEDPFDAYDNLYEQLLA